MDTIFDFVQHLWPNFQHGYLPDLGTWNYMLVAVFMMFQGRISAVLGGIAAATGYLNLFPIIMVALAARLFVDLFWYNVGSTGQINRIGQRFGPFRHVADHVEGQVSQKPLRFMLMAKLSNGMSLPAVVAAGNAHMPYRRWLPASFAGEFLWTLPLLLFGYFATDALAQWEGGLSYVTTGMTVIFLLALVISLARSRRRSA